MFGTTFVDISRLALGTYGGIYLGSIYGTTYETFEVLFMGASIGSIDEKEVGCTEGNELWISDGRVFGTTHDTYDGRDLGL